MAQPVPYRVFTPPVDQDALTKKLEDLPREHAEALISGYQLLQAAQDSGTLDTLRGALGAGDAIINHVVDLVSAPETVTALRNLFLLGKLLGNINPQILHGALGGVATDGSQRLQEEPPSIFAILRKLSSRDARRGLGVAADLLVAFGNGLAQEQGIAPETSKKSVAE